MRCEDDRQKNPGQHLASGAIYACPASRHYGLPLAGSLRSASTDGVTKPKRGRTLKGVRWSEEFSTVLLRFADRIADVGSITVDDALRTWTPFYLNFSGLDRSFDPPVPLWQQFLAGLSTADDPPAWIHSFYLAHSYDYLDPPDGCFIYACEADTRTIRFHFFANHDTSGHSPISEDRRKARMREFTALFADVQRAVPEAEAVRGRSWLYNLPQYCRLFPPEYIHAAVPTEPELQFTSLWGQFLARNWKLRHGPSAVLLEKAAAADSRRAAA